MQKRQTPALAAVCVSAAFILSGCGLFKEPPPPQQEPPKEPLIVTHESTVDPVHVRDASVSHFDQHRGGAALRAEGWQDVLWSAHYEPRKESGSTGVKNPKDAAAAGAAAVGTDGRNDRAAAQKDASIYAKKAVQEEDASICAPKSDSKTTEP